MSMVDLVIIGAGPGGIASAVEASKLGLSVVLLDEQEAPGGQIYRDVDKAANLRGDILGADYVYGQTLTTALSASGVQYISGSVVWSIEEGFVICYTKQGVAHQLAAQTVLIATGAIERPMPIEGWTKLGVMTAGAGQILLKQSGVVAQRAALVGSGPLLYLAAVQLTKAGSPPVALIETQSSSDLWAAMPHFLGALKGWRYLIKGLKMILTLRWAGVPRFTAATEVSIGGESSVSSVRFVSNGKAHAIACDTVFLHHGVIPNVQAARSLDVTYEWSNSQNCFLPKLDAWGQTDVAGIFITGDGAGIAGAISAELRGRLSALQVAYKLGFLSKKARDKEACPIRRALNKDLAIRPFLDRAYPPYVQALTPPDHVVVCRCEDVRAGDVRRYAQMGCKGPNQTKAFGRVGMGSCQGRYCGLTVTQILAQVNERTPQEIGYYKIRSPLKPITLGELAALDQIPLEQLEQGKHDD